jgi:chromosome segregation ATPase
MEATNLVDFGNKFQERTQQLQAAQAQLEEVRQQWQTSQVLLQEHETKSMEARQQLLQTTSRCNRIEWEYNQLQETVRDCQEKTAKLVQQKLEIELQLQEEQENWKQNVEEAILAPHMTRTDLYQNCWEAQVQAKEMSMREREDCHNELQRRIDQMSRDRIWLDQQTVQVERDIETAQQHSQRQDEQLEQLAKQVREALEKVNLCDDTSIASLFTDLFFLTF